MGIDDQGKQGSATSGRLLSVPLRGRETAWTTLGYAAQNLTRWILLASMLAFLLSAILALHEALNFQDRVLELAGNDLDRARRVLGVLHDTLENPDSYPEDRELPYASIAVKLDRLSKVQETLTGFAIPAAKTEDASDSSQQDAKNIGSSTSNDASPNENADAESAGSTDNEADHASDDAAAQWQAASNRLKLSIADLDDTLKAGDPARRLLEALHQTRNHIRTLAAFKGSIAEADRSSLPSPGTAYAASSLDDLAREADRFELQLVADELKRDVVKVEERVNTSPDDELLVAHLEHLKGKIGRLEDFYDSADLTYVPSTDDQPDEPPLPVNLVIEDIDHRINEIESILLKVDDGFVAAAKLADLINQARRFSDRLQDMPTEGVTRQKVLGEKAVEGTAAVVAFETTRGELSEAIQEIENQLDRRTRVMVVADQLAKLEEEGDQGRHSRALAILRGFDSVGRFEGTLLPFHSLAEIPVLNIVSGLGFDPQRISTLSRETLALLFVFVIGAIGSVIYITKDSIQLVLEGNWVTDRPKRSLAWYLFRPVFGVIVALAAFLLFKAGQLAMGNSGVVDGSQDFNLPILSVIALFAGLLSWQALEVIETRGASWFRSQKRQALWATGLENRLYIEQHSIEELASSIGRSVDQVFRWLVFRDRVSPEMQDRIADWLDVPFNQLFRNDQPVRKTLWLRVQPLDDGGLAREKFEEQLAEEQFHADQLAAWLACGEPVPPKVQDRILLAMDRPMPAVFTDKRPELQILQGDRAA
ncbi:MAG: hypothetical protein R3F54_15685 [Alphaproteobacteria bacterium]